MTDIQFSKIIIINLFITLLLTFITIKNSFNSKIIIILIFFWYPHNPHVHKVIKNDFFFKKIFLK